MKNLFSLRSLIVVSITFITSLTYGQTNADKIQAKWVVEKIDPTDNRPQSKQAKEDLLGVYLIFGNDELLITKKTDTGENLIKKGSYSITDNILTLGKDKAMILELSDKRLTIQIPRQGTLYLAKM